MEEKFKILKYISEDSSLNQRELAEIAEVSLGKINSIIKECSENELINRMVDNRENKYVITEKGFKELEKSLKKVKSTMLILNEESNTKIKVAVILAAGKRDGFNKPIGCLDLEGVTIIERSIKILKENGIEKIIMVTGYKEAYYKEILKNEECITFITNSKYKWTGTMQSLFLAKQYVNEDFILLESDLIYESKAIFEMLNNSKRDCLLITNESGSGDEAFVQIKDNCLFKMAKDIHQFNRTDGEMVGISKISYKMFNMILNEFEGNINPYLNYEYLILDISRNYRVYCLKIDDLAWNEVDNLKDYRNVKDNCYPRIKRKEIEFKKERIKLLVENSLDISAKSITNIDLAGGMTNNNYKISIGEENYILRIPGAGTENMISRKNEMINSKLASELGINPDVFSYNENDGVKITKFIEGAETLNGRTSKKDNNMNLITTILRDLHNSTIKMENTFDVFEEIIKYEKILNDLNGKFFEDYNVIRPIVMSLKELMNEYGFKLVPSHNDTVPENFVKDKNGRIYLIDWEYSGLNDEMWDLAGHSLECDFTEDDEELFLDMYFQGNIKKSNRFKILMNKICQDFLWSIWALIKDAEGIDFGTYGIDRYNRAKKNIEKLEALI
ncbi:MAG: phosphotransferase [Bacilli bacterium]